MNISEIIENAQNLLGQSVSIRGTLIWPRDRSVSLPYFADKSGTKIFLAQGEKLLLYALSKHVDKFGLDDKKSRQIPMLCSGKFENNNLGFVLNEISYIELEVPIAAHLKVDYISDYYSYTVKISYGEYEVNSSTPYTKIEKLISYKKKFIEGNNNTIREIDGKLMVIGNPIDKNLIYCSLISSQIIEGIYSIKVPCYPLVRDMIPLPNGADLFDATVVGELDTKIDDESLKLNILIQLTIREDHYLFL